jgi:hypothetical protein
MGLRLAVAYSPFPPTLVAVGNGGEWSEPEPPHLLLTLAVQPLGSPLRGSIAAQQGSVSRKE